jgi:uncharacterized protein YdaU (DUF1376 family)
VNYYEHHIGDYAEATAHLSFVEDAAYSRCIRKYYASESPLPGDVKAVQRLVGARTRDEKAAVDTVLREFFTLLEDGWHNTRCDEEIARYQAKRSNAQRSANSRWSGMRTHSDGNANASGTHTERIADALPTQSDGNALQSPVSSLQSPIPSKRGEREARATRLPSDWSLTPERRAIAETEHLDPERTFSKFSNYWRSASGAKARKVDWEATWRNWCMSETDRKPNGVNGSAEHLTKFDRIQASTKVPTNEHGQPIDEAGNVIPF